MDHNTFDARHIPIKNKYSTYFLPIVLMIVDYIAVICAANLAVDIRNSILPNGVELQVSWLSFHVIMPVTYMLFIQICGLYTRRMQFWRIISNIFKANIYAAVTLVVMMYLAHIAGNTSRLFLVLMWILAFVIIVLYTFIVKKVLDKFGVLQLPVLIMGAGKTAAIVLEHFKNDTGAGYHFVGYLEDNDPEPSVAKMMPHLGRFKDAEDVIKQTGVCNVMVIAPGLDNEAVEEIVYKLQPLVKSISFIPDMGNMPVAVLDMESLVDGHIVAFRIRNNLSIWHNRLVKRLFDIVCTVIGGIVISPFLLAIALWIHHDSPGPVIFTHIRIGKDGKPFGCFKFRTMVVDAEQQLRKLLENDPAAKEEWERDFKLKDDPRITKSGAFLRKTSLDELPQIFNVLKGEMSLVGPRPIIHDEVRRYGPYIRDYYMVRPGITGIWQTSGRSDIGYAERVQLDTWYVRNWNVWYDMVLIWRTFKAVLQRKGAY